jgi:hypothetical protein
MNGSRRSWEAYGSSLALTLALLVCLVASAAAQSPAFATITPTSSVITWKGTMTGAPMEGLSGESGCTDGTNCEWFTLTISNDTWTGSAVALHVSWTLASDDYDFYIHKGGQDGPVICSANTSAAGDSSGERCLIDPNRVGTGTYSVHVIFSIGPAAAADEYTGTATVVPAPGAPTPAPVGTGPLPRYQIYTPPPLSGLGINAGEPSIGINWTTGRAMFQSDLQTLRITFNDGAVFPNPRAIWENKSPVTSVQDSDPILWTDTSTGRTIAGMLLLATGRNEASVTDNDGDLWIPTQGSAVNAAVDHETVGGGPYAPPLTATAYPNAVYYCSNDLVTALCERSDDGGLTYGPAVPIYTSQCSNLHGHVKVAPDGTVYVPNKACGQNQAVVVSEDNGQSWDIRPILSSQTSSSDPSVSIGTKGTLYYGWADGDSNALVSVSHDKGHTWTSPLDVGAALNVNGVAFPEVIAGDDNRVAYAFLGSTTPGTIYDANYRGIFHMYVAHSYDSGATWQTIDTTPNDPIQRGPIWFAGGAVTYRNLLDFNDAQIDRSGHVYIAAADGCAGGECVNASGGAIGNAYTALGTIIRQTGGRPLFAAYDPPNVANIPGAPYVTANREGNHVYLSWTTADNGGSPIKNFVIYRGTAPGAETALKQVKGTVYGYTDTVNSTATYYYRVVATNKVGASTGNNEVYAKYYGDSCGGFTVNADAAGDQTGSAADRDMDLLSVTASEPQPDKLRFVMKVASLAPPNPLNPNNLIPNRRWRVLWAYPNGNSSQGQYYVGMSTDNNGVVSFSYGVVQNGTLALVLGNPQEAPVGIPLSGTWSQDGTITIVVAKSQVGSPRTGDLLGAVRGLTFADSTTNLRSTYQIDNPSGGTTNDDLARSSVYVVRSPACQ